MKSNSEKTISDLDLKDAFRIMKIDITQDQLDFMIASVILDSEGLKKLQYLKFYEIFQKSNYN